MKIKMRTRIIIIIRNYDYCYYIFNQIIMKKVNENKLQNSRKNFQKVKLTYDTAVQAAKSGKSNKKLAEKV